MGGKRGKRDSRVYSSGIKASRLSHSARYQLQMDRLTQELHNKEKEYIEACILRSMLQERVGFLESISESSRCHLVRLIILRTAVLRSPVNVNFSNLPLSVNVIHMNALPTSIAGYDDTLLDRIASMSLGDCVCIYRAFMSK